MSDTPETNHLETELGQTALQAHPVIWEHSRKLERERDEAQEIIRMAKAKFCEEGSDGNIASEMFSILSGGK
jgi:hypothetical protein